MFNLVSVIGLGKLGLPIAAAIASRGVWVYGVDNDATRLAAIFFDADYGVHEPGLDRYVERAGSDLAFNSEAEHAAEVSDATFIIVPTPSDASHRFSNKYVLDVCEQVGRGLRKRAGPHVVVVVSTVFPGSMDGPIQGALESASGKRCGQDFGLCYSPQFVALGEVIRGFLNPAFVLIGESDPQAGEALAQFFRKVCESEPPPPAIRTNFVNAELAKLALNCYVTTKMTFANYLARLCEALPGADVDVVSGVLGHDPRIGRRYLTGATAWGGPCFPRDVRALAALSDDLGVVGDLLRMIGQFNRGELIRLFDMVDALTPPGKAITVLGLTYKMGTDVTDESVGIALCGLLREAGRNVYAYDPVLTPDVDGQECIDTSALVVITLPYNSFRQFEFRQGQIIVDCWRVLEDVPEGVRWVGIGRGGSS